MSKHGPRTGKRPLRGANLDQALAVELQRMLAEGAEVSPISLSTVARRLALGSRTALYEPARLERIRAASVSQKPSRRTQLDRKADADAQPQSDLPRLREQLNQLRGYVVQIAINAHRLGLQPELLLPLSQRERKADGSLDAEGLAIQYLTGIGLIAKLDPNVRSLAR